MKKLTFTELVELLPDQLDQSLVEYTRDVALLHSRYIFLSRKKGLQYGFCTHCLKTFRTSAVSMEELMCDSEPSRNYIKHNELVTCPKCGSSCIAKSSGIPRSQLYDNTLVTHYCQSPTDPDVLIAILLYVVKDYRKDITKESIATSYTINRIAILKRNEYAVVYSLCKDLPMKNGLPSLENICKADWPRLHQTFPEHIAANTSLKNNIHKDSLHSAIKGTSMKYADYKGICAHYSDCLRYLALFCQYPCFEYLHKFGLSDIITDKLHNRYTYGAINWRGKTSAKVFRMSGEQVFELKKALKQLKKVDCCKMKAMQNMLRESGKIDISKVEPHAFFMQHGQSMIDPILKYVKIEKAIEYTTHQSSIRSGYLGASEYVIRDWNDYLADAVALRMDLTNTRVLMPKNLHDAHQKTIARRKIIASKEQNSKIFARYPILTKRFSFSTDGIMIIAPKSAKDIINEGSKLNHCVGNYTERHADGETTILLIRKTIAPTKPWYTMEVSADRILQVRGKSNCLPTPELKKVLDAFTAKKLKKSKKPEQQARIMVAV